MREPTPIEMTGKVHIEGAPNIIPWVDSWRMLYDSGKSLSRIGDGEIMLVGSNGGPVFQRRDDGLAAGIRRVLAEPNDNCLVGINRLMFYATDFDTLSFIKWMRKEMVEIIHGDGIMGICKLPLYLDAAMTIPRKTYARTPEQYIIRAFTDFQQFMSGQRVLLVTGRSEDNLKMWEEMIGDFELVECPLKNAWDSREDIKAAIRKANPNGDKLVVMQCGPAATVLAWELSSEMRCWDLGHFAAEFSYWLNGKSPTDGWVEFFKN